MEHVEIERKFLLHTLPDLSQYACKTIEQAYLCTEPVVRIRQSNDKFTLTYKGAGLMAHDEYNLPLTADAYAHLKAKADGNVITKTRYLIPLADTDLNESCRAALRGGHLTVELDVFEGIFDGLLLAEIEFPNEDAANAFRLLPWFRADVTSDTAYHNSTMSEMSPAQAKELSARSGLS